MKKSRVTKLTYGDDEKHKSRKLTCKLVSCGWTTSTKLTFHPCPGAIAVIDNEVRQLLERTEAEWLVDDATVYAKPMLPYNARKVKVITAPKCNASLKQALTQLTGRECLVTLNAQYREFDGKEGDHVRAVVLQVVDIRLV